ncbi:mPR-typeG-protein-coupled receptor [Aureobasidium pullulans]|uniref:MPR-typeG-protein-coupled receptor n=1 Tax=Aureobasidium pullulans TaxID=5580 RepID=A0A4S8Z5L2_AURPU|nr:mPR-typeG-protein-coupled receptor [Aureobasidium pullulans]
MSKPLLRKSEARPRKARLLFYDEIRESTVGNAKTSMLTLMPSSCMAEVGLETAEVESTFNAIGHPTANSWNTCLKSMLGWHNETINIHSHTFGAALFALLPFHFYYTLYQQTQDAQPIDAIVFILYFIGVAICFICSAGCHVVWTHSPPIASLGNRLDFCGIVILMWGASLASIHFAFICDPWLRSLHWILVSASASGCVAFTLYPAFIKPTFRAMRAVMYASLGLFAVVFVLHGVYLYGFAVQRRRLALEWMTVMALLNLLGAMFYALRFPEAWFPYRFDFLGASHQIFHVLVLAAGLVHYRGLASAFVEVRGLHHTCEALSTY